MANPNPVTFIQKTNGSFTSAATASTAFGTTPLIGDLGVAIIWVQKATTGSIVSPVITDTQGNPWYILASGLPFQSASVLRGIFIAYTPNLSASANTVTAVSTGASAIQADLLEATPGVYDQASQLTDNTASDAFAANPITTNNKGCFAVTAGAGVGSGGSVVYPSGFTAGDGSVTNASFSSWMYGYLAQTTAAAISPTTSCLIGQYGAILVTFRPCGFSPADDRNFGQFPNNARNLDGSLIYDVENNASYTAPVDSRAQGKEVDSRTVIPTNCRVD